MTTEDLVRTLIDYNYQLEKKLEEVAPEWYSSSDLIAEIDDFYKDNIDGTDYSNE